MIGTTSGAFGNPYSLDGCSMSETAVCFTEFIYTDASLIRYASNDTPRNCLIQDFWELNHHRRPSFRKIKDEGAAYVVQGGLAHLCL